MDCIDGNEPQVENAILNLFKNQLFTDVTVKYNPGNKQYRVHKLILALYSPVLCDDFYGKSECDDFYGKSESDDIIYIEGSEPSAVENMISFCYGELPVFKNISEIKATKVIAERYKIVELLNICMKEIDTVTVDTSNVLILLEMSVQSGNKNKENECLEIISHNRETVFASELFLKMKFEIVNQIFEKLREMCFLTEVQYLRSAIEWMRSDYSENKEKLMEKIEITKLSQDEFVDIIISFPDFFTNTEIAKTFRKIKETINDTSPNQQSDESETTVKVIVGADDPSSAQIREKSNQRCSLTLTISDGSGGNKQGILSVDDGISRRALSFSFTENLKDGMFLHLLSLGNGEYPLNNVNVTYDGVYCLMKYLRADKRMLSPLNYIEILKAASQFGLRKVRESCLEDLINITDIDPAFLDALILYPNFLDKVQSLIISNTLYIILHPNFVDCSVTLIMLIFTQTKLKLPAESQLLLVSIPWLESRNRLRWDYRSSLLNAIAFENISLSDVEYVSRRYPNFFTKDEIDPLLLYKQSNNSGSKESLPKWYNFKQREYYGFS